MYSIVKTSAEASAEVGKMINPVLTFTILSGLATRDEALELAEVAASEHAERIGVKYQACGDFVRQTGYSFITNNGTYVWYQVREED